MATKKEVSKQVKKTKVSKTTPKPDEGDKLIRNPKEVILMKAEVKLVSFEVTAVIPTQEYGNIMPKFVVEAPGLGIQDAIDHVMPFVETLYQTYGETPRNGKPLKFLNKANVSVTEKIVDPKAVAPVAPTPRNTVPDSKTVADLGNPIPTGAKAPEKAPEAPTEPEGPKSAAYIKAEGAIASAMSLDALNLVEDRVIQSEKLTKEEKNSLYTLILKKHKELKEKTA